MSTDSLNAKFICNGANQPGRRLTADRKMGVQSGSEIVMQFFDLRWQAVTCAYYHSDCLFWTGGARNSSHGKTGP
jgi:hypothetical protein